MPTGLAEKVHILDVRFVVPGMLRSTKGYDDDHDQGWERDKDVITVLLNPNFAANRTPRPDKLAEMDLSNPPPIAEVMVRQRAGKLV